MTIRIVRIENKKYKCKIIAENLNAEWRFRKIRCRDEDNIKVHFTKILSVCVGWIVLVKKRTEW